MRENVSARNRIIKDSTLDWKPVFDQLVAYGERMRPWVADVSLFLARRCMAGGKTVMFEGAQATLLDIDHGTYPFVTSSNASVGGVCTGLGVPPRAIGGVLGVAKAYTTRVGEGPLPTELSGALADRLRESGQEYGASTGRPRRCGWFDAVVVRYSARINGLDALALTKLDVLDGLPEVLLCTGYKTTRGHAHRVSGGPADAGRRRAGLRDACPAGRRRPRASRSSISCRRRRSATSRGSKKSAASPARSFRPAPIARETIVKKGSRSTRLVRVAGRRYGR